ncbi:MAG TPA: hypothetical protein VGB00_03295 [Pyrinomonadaceae bacterium]|jgi:hypothetical protein
MKDDYLWDKTGEDPDIEKLENALELFRYKETAPLELPAKVLPFRKEESRQPRRRIFSYAMAAAAGLVFGVIALGVWMQILKNNAEIPANLTETAKTEIVLPTPKPPVVDGHIVSPVDNVENQKQSPARKIAAIRRNIPVKISRKETKARNVRATKTEIKLTKEEQYAYDQLMLALAITSSKFRLVKDKIEGIEEKNAVIGNGQ